MGSPQHELKVFTPIKIIFTKKKNRTQIILFFFFIKIALKAQLLQHGFYGIRILFTIPEVRCRQH